VITSEERKDLFAAISKAQGEFTTVEKGKDNPFFKSKYAPLDSIIEMIRPILAKHGLSVVQFTDVPEAANGIIIETVITHSTGQYISGRLLMPMAKVDPQGAGSAITYGRRYALAAALGIVSDEDADGNGHTNGTSAAKVATPNRTQAEKPANDTAESHPDCISDAQRKMIFAKMKGKEIPPEAFKAAFGLESSALLEKAQMNDVLSWIEDYTPEPF